MRLVDQHRLLREYFVQSELPEKKYYIFGKEGAKNLAEDLEIPFLGEIPQV